MGRASTPKEPEAFQSAGKKNTGKKSSNCATVGPTTHGSFRESSFLDAESHGCPDKILGVAFESL